MATAVQALKQAQAVLRGLTFKDTQITNALTAIWHALDDLESAHCGCADGTCESKPSGCRMAAEVAALDPRAM